MPESSPERDRTVEQELSGLLAALHYRGLSVGVDDVERVVKVFRHADTWSRERRVRALQALLARTEEERQVVDQLAQFLFVGSPKPPDVERPSDAARPSETVTATPFASKGVKGPLQTAAATTQRTLPRRRRWAGVALAFVGAVALIAVVHYFRQRPVDPKRPTEVDAGADTGATAIASTERVEHSPQDPSEGIVQDSEVEFTPSCPSSEVSDLPVRIAKWLSIALTPTVLFGFSYLAWRTRTSRRQARNVRRLAESSGKRTYRFDYSGDALEPMPDQALREAAFQLSAPNQEVEAPWLHIGETVRNTVQNLGLVSFAFARWREHTPVVVLEDVSASMARWPGYGAQFAAALARQGAGSVHYYFDRDPSIVYSRSDLSTPELLDAVLSGPTRPTVVVVSDAAGFDDGRVGEPSFLASLGGALWVHPQPPELWGLGARWLSQRLRMLTGGSESLLRIGTASLDRAVALPAPWSPPHVYSERPEAILRAFRGALGEEAFRLLSAAAVLERRGRLNARLFAALRIHLVSAPWHLAERIWTFPGLKVAADGSIRLDPTLADLLSKGLETEHPELFQEVLKWAREQVDRGLQRFAPARDGREPSEPRSIAEVLARIARVRFAADDPTQREAALDLARELNQAGFGELLAGAASESEREGWNIGRLRRVRATQYRHWVAAAICLLLAVGSVVFASSQAVRARLDPPEPKFKLTWQGASDPTISIVGEPRLFACDANAAGSTLRVWVDGVERQSVEKSPPKAGQGALFDLGSRIRESDYATKPISVEYGYSEAARSKPEPVRLWPEPELTARVAGEKVELFASLRAGFEWPTDWDLRRDDLPVQTFEIPGGSNNLSLAGLTDTPGPGSYVYRISATSSNGLGFSSLPVLVTVSSEEVAPPSGGPNTSGGAPPKPSTLEILLNSCRSGNVGNCAEALALAQSRREQAAIRETSERLRASCKSGSRKACSFTCGLLYDCPVHPVCKRVCSRLAGCPIGSRVECITDCADEDLGGKCATEFNLLIQCVEPWIKVTNCEVDGEGAIKKGQCKAAEDAFELCTSQTRSPPDVPPDEVDVDAGEGPIPYDGPLPTTEPVPATPDGADAGPGEGAEEQPAGEAKAAEEAK